MESQKIIFQSTNQILVNPPLLNYDNHYISIIITIIMANLRYSSNQSPGKSSNRWDFPLLWTDRASRFWLDDIRDVSIKNWRAMSVSIYIYIIYYILYIILYYIILYYIILYYIILYMYINYKQLKIS